MSRSPRFSIMLVVAMLMALLTSSCSLTKFVPNKQFLFNRVEVKSDVDNISKTQIKQYLRQKPNTGIFGRIRLSLAIYNMSGRDSSKWINRKLRSAGEPPVIFDADDMEMSCQNIKGYMKNKGYHNVEVEADTIVKGRKRKKMNVRFDIKGNQPYKLSDISLDIEDDTLRAYMYNYQFSAKPGDLFDLDALQSERAKMVTFLRNSGFYYMSNDYIYAEADTTVDDHGVSVVFKCRPMVMNVAGGQPKELKNHIRVKIRNVNVYPWEYNTDLSYSTNYKDTLSCGSMNYYYHGKRRLCPSSLYMKIHVLPGQYYSAKNVERTNSSLSSLGTTKYVNIYFRRVPGCDSLVDCNISITPNRVQSYSVEVEGTNTDGDIGAALNGTYTHRNIFRGADQLSIKTRIGYLPMGDIKDALNDRSLEVGGEAALTFPKVLFPLIPEKLRRRIRASTEFSLSYNYQTTPWYDRNIANAGIEYWWTTGSLDNERYSIKLLDLSYVYLPTISDYFRQTYLNANSIIRYSYEDHIIMALGFTFSRNNKHNNYSNFFSYRGSVETAGNLLSGICSLAGVKKDDGAWRILDIRYSQYVKGEFSYSYNQVVNDKNTLVYHVGVGLAYPYGNADVVPFEKRFYAGGANSVRGWSIRSLGPGIYKSTGGRTDFNQSGDIKLDLNFEYRFKLFWILEGAAFVDAGNVWTINSYQTQQGGQFDFSEFYKQLACSYGLGLRFDFSFFLVRLDVGARLYDPSQDSRKWRHPFNINDMAWHLAIGYPF